jgi:hypothetical protein
VIEMIEAIKTFLNGYRAVGIRKTEGMEGLGFIASIMKNGRLLGEVADYGDGGAMHIDFPYNKDEQDLNEFCKALYPDYQFEQASIFVGAMVDYELAIKSLKTKAKKALLVADETQLDEHGVAKSYSSWKLLPTEENKARVLAKHPQTKFLNDELDLFEDIKKPRK